MKNVANLLDEKGHAVHTIGPDETVAEALKRMADHNVGALPVLDGDRLVGLISERDYARKVLLAERSSPTTRVREIMMTRVPCVAATRTLEECMAVMTERRVRHLPVVDQGKLIGLISIGDLIKAIVAEQQFIISQLEQYISS
ncbi:CBS domain-containing protein [Thioalkalicoccus limnaeus]|uniref:CBS domain-containing protein n=1 Tax=Thioalkalicoccus limnaeus TaxID=120681 RepID=A0ABV4BG68_9GAMM